MAQKKGIHPRLDSVKSAISGAAHMLMDDPAVDKEYMKKAAAKNKKELDEGSERQKGK